MLHLTTSLLLWYDISAVIQLDVVTPFLFFWNHSLLPLDILLLTYTMCTKSCFIIMSHHFHVLHICIVHFLEAKRRDWERVRGAGTGRGWGMNECTSIFRTFSQVLMLITSSIASPPYSLSPPLEYTVTPSPLMYLHYCFVTVSTAVKLRTWRQGSNYNL